MRGGFTLLEIAIVFAIFILLIGVGLPIGLDAYRNYVLVSEIRNFLNILRRAENLALANVSNQSYGVAIQSDQFVLFRGSSYVNRNSSFDEIYLRTVGITVSSTPEIVFSPLAATTTATAVNISNGLASTTISVNSAGTIDW
ncbi:MAG: hypothetical protein AAB884_02780 [Patescibacteria group bacterium]